MSPISADRVQSYYRENTQALPQQSISLEKEQFDFYLPLGEPPANGYGLIVFIAPYDEAEIPFKWRKVFDRHGIIYVAARKSGNDHNMIGRRIPLALHAYENIVHRYRLDPERVYISGFSGGSRTAMRVALYYPDIFYGAILNSGSDSFGNSGIGIPSEELFSLFQSRTRMVQVTGTEDELVKIEDARMRTSAESFCVRNLYSQPMRKMGHALMGALEVENAIVRIEKMPIDESNLSECRSRLKLAIDNGLDEVQKYLDQGLEKKSGEQLSIIDNHYGGLAAPRSVEIARKILSAEHHSR
ncbi:MAG: PHB depolymerase family esterase [Arenimonas sp.]